MDEQTMRPIAQCDRALMLCWTFDPGTGVDVDTAQQGDVPHRHSPSTGMSQATLRAVPAVLCQVFRRGCGQGHGGEGW
ncbi:hypothetical protein Misp01_47970 [Microtetraspora sp. NBRC 13810]|nr:hypothetical protein Misp01_47970 [Microtetraspora sp. NBRC 13810]